MINIVFDETAGVTIDDIITITTIIIITSCITIYLL